MLNELGVLTEGKAPEENLTDEEERIARTFAVVNPQKVGSTVKYTVQGQDASGTFEVARRYNEFYALREALVSRWPGCYVPAIPEKSVANNAAGQAVTG